MTQNVQCTLCSVGAGAVLGGVGDFMSARWGGEARSSMLNLTPIGHPLAGVLALAPALVTLCKKVWRT
jgi:hypothetical protein